MDFGPPARPSRAEAVLPMINLVFLLLIFFLIAATLTPPPPEPVEPPEVPEAAAMEPGAVRLSLGADGVVVHDGARGDAALAGLGEALSGNAVVAIHADRRAPAASLARLLGDLEARGATAIRLVTAPVR